MKKLILICLFLTSFSAQALEFEFIPMVGLGYRIDFENTRNYEDDYQTAEKKKREDKDTGLFTGKMFLFHQPYSQSKMLVGGIGVAYQWNNKFDYSFSPVAWKDPNGLTWSLDLYKQSDKGGFLGMSIGWSF